MQNSVRVAVAINEMDYGSTGNIASSILDELKKEGYKTYFAAARISNFNESKFQIGLCKFDYLFNKFLCRLSASDGFHSKLATKKLCKFLRKVGTDIILLNNAHGGYIHLPTLFKFASTNKTKIVWTLHDCWVFTGKCSHFAFAKCDKWKTGCHNCPELKTHPKAWLFDRTKILFKKKINLIRKYKDIIEFVCPSKWMLDKFKQSKLSDLNCSFIENGISFNVNKKEVKELEGLDKNKIIVFSGAYVLGERKGIDLINKLADELDKNKFEFICAGKIDGYVSPNIIKLNVLSREELNYVYSISDIFLNPSFEESFGLTNLEAILNGCYVISFSDVGVNDQIPEKFGSFVEKGNYLALKNSLLSISSKISKNNNAEEFLQNYSIVKMVSNYAKLINDLLEK